MFQFLRRVSGSLLPRPDRPWREDATSHAPTIGRKRRYSVTESDNDESASTAKRTKSDPAEPEDSSASEAESSKNDDDVPAVDTREVREVTKGVNEVDLEHEDVAQESSTRAEVVQPLPESPSGSPEPESLEPPQLGAAEETKARDDEDSVASSVPEATAEETTVSADETTPERAPVATVESGLCDAPGTLEAKA